MNVNPSLLPKEVAALVHHIELNRSGWWDKVIQRLTLAAVWWCDHSPSVEEIKKTLSQEFKLSLSVDKLLAVLKTLENQNLLVALTENRYRIPEKKRLEFEQDIAAAEKVESAACEYFCSLVKESLSNVDATQTWAVFQQELLTPLIKEAGANAYRLITGDRLHVEGKLIDHFLKNFDLKFHAGLKELITKFLDPKKEEVRAHISRMLHARFCVEAGGLPEDVILKLNSNIGKQVNFRIFVDTNFLFSLLELHDNPSNASARELLELIAQLKSNPQVKLYIVPRTIEEAKSSISSTKQRLSQIPKTENFTKAALSVGISGMAERFLSERLRRGGNLTVDDWFDPYLTNFVAIARGKGVEFFNESLDSYAIRQDVVDDIHYVKEVERRLDKNRQKPYEVVAHDMILWHFVRDQRPSYIESPIDTRDWILTVDYRLIGFDQYKQKSSRSKIPLCLHPTSLIQLLQFWVPRTKEFEEAMLGSLRLPFLFQEFDIEAERTSLKVLNGLGRFEGREDISAETITSVILNDGLRARLQSGAAGSGEAEIALIRDALIEEMKARASDEAAKSKKLQAMLTQKERTISELDANNRFQSEHVQRLNAQISEEELRTKAANERAAQLQSILERNEQNEERRLALRSYLGWLALVMLATSITAWQADRLFPDVAQIIGILPMKALASIFVFVVGHLLLELTLNMKERMTQLWLFKKIREFRVWLWSIAILSFMVGVFGNLYANRIQDNISQEANLSEISESRTPVVQSEALKSP